MPAGGSRIAQTWASLHGNCARHLCEVRRRLSTAEDAVTTDRRGTTDRDGQAALHGMIGTWPDWSLPLKGQIERAHFGPDPRHGPSRTQLVSPVRLSACRPYNRNCDRRHKHLLPHRLGVSTGQSIQPDKTPLLLTDSRVTACRQDIRPDRENTESLVTYRAIRACCWDKMIQPVRIGVISTCPAALKIRAACRQENRYSR